MKTDIEVCRDVVEELRWTPSVLTGRVHSWSEHESAAETAWSDPGVTQVKNHISVGP